MSYLPSRERVADALENAHITDSDGDVLWKLGEIYALEGQLVDREAISEGMVERMAESRYNARFGGFAWTDPDFVSHGHIRDAFMASARRDLAAAFGEDSGG